MRAIKGWDYRKQQPVERTVRDWRAELDACLKRGGFINRERGETVLHARGGTIEAEIYALVYPR